MESPKKEGLEKASNRAAKKHFKGIRISKVYTKVGYIIYKVKSDKSLARICQHDSMLDT